MTALKKTGYIAGLDGWRAIAILGVLAAHSHAFRIAGHSVTPSLGPGWQGVYVFFAISGFLITTRILEEEVMLGRVNLKGFYLRRILRIQPAALVYLAVVALLTLAGCVAQLWKYWFGALLFFSNYQAKVNLTNVHEGALTGPFWTLAVEEHFYLLLSLFLFFVLKYRVRLLAVLYFASVGWTLVCLFHWPALQNPKIFMHTPIQIQFLIPATILAMLLRRPSFAMRARYWLRPWAVIWVPIGCLLVSVALRRILGLAWMGSHPAVSRLLSPHLELGCLVLFTFWITATTLHPESMTTRLLEMRPLRWIGLISYSLYLWNTLTFFGPFVATGPTSIKVFAYVGHTPITWAATFALACMSFYLVERPMMRLGHRLAPPSTPGRSDMQSEPSVEAAIEAKAQA